MDHEALIPTGCGELLTELKGQIRGARMQAALAANEELTVLYWDIADRPKPRNDETP